MPNIREILEAIGKPSADVYAPSDDTFLMVDTISKLSLRDKKVLDMGTGSGILGLVCAQMGAEVTVADIEASAVNNVEVAARKLNLTIKTTQSDIFSNLAARFDLVLFNPPYLPPDKVKDTTVDGGRRGRKIIDQFLNDLPLHLKEDGFALLLVSSLNDPRAIMQSHPELSFTVAMNRNLFFEELQVLLCRLRNLSN